MLNTQVERGEQADQRLPEILLARAHAFRVLVHHLAPVVHPADGAEAQRHDQHDPHEAVGQVEPQQRRRRRSRSGSARRPWWACRSWSGASACRSRAPAGRSSARSAGGSPHGPATRPISSAVSAAITARKVRYWKTRRKPNSGESVCSHWARLSSMRCGSLSCCCSARSSDRLDHALHLHEARALDQHAGGGGSCRSTAAFSASTSSKCRRPRRSLRRCARRPSVNSCSMPRSRA